MILNLKDKTLNLKFHLIKGILYFIDFLPEENNLKASNITQGEAIAFSIFDGVFQHFSLREFYMVLPDAFYSHGFISGLTTM